jgi:peroxiredoxin
MSSVNGRAPADRKGQEKRVTTTRPPAPSGARPNPTPAGSANRRRAAERQRLRNLLLIGSGVLVAIIVVGALVLKPGGGSGSGLTDPNALNPSPNLLAVGTAAPDFTLSSVDGQKLSLSSLRGHPVLLEFFAVWCPHCQNESTVLNQIDQNFGATGEKTVAVLANPYGRDYDTSNGTDKRLADKGDISWFETTFGVKHPTLIDPNFAVVNQYGASSYPTIYVIDSKGVVRFAQDGEVAYQDLANALSALH